MFKLLTTLFLLIMPLIGACQDTLPLAVGCEIHSSFLDEDRFYLVGLPDGYSPEKEYPVVYALDAEWTFQITYAITKELCQNGRIPPHIVIGVMNMGPQKRFSDLTFGPTMYDSDGNRGEELQRVKEEEYRGAEFLSFLERELIPHVNSSYGTSGFNILLGHSLSGYYGAQIFSNQQSFRAFQLYDPSVWYNGREAIALLEKERSDDKVSNVFLSSATDNGEQGVYFLNSIKELGSTLSTYSNVNVGQVEFEDEHHGTLVLPSLIEGFKWLYAGYDLGYIAPDSKITVELYEEHYQRFSSRVHFQFQAPIEGYRWVAYAKLKQEEWAEAIKAYRKCIGAYEYDSNVLSEFAEALENSNEFEEALEYYARASGVMNDEDWFDEHFARVRQKMEKR